MRNKPDDIEIKEILDDFEELDQMPWWAEHMGINLLNWDRRKLIKLYLITYYGAIKEQRDLYERLEDKNKIIDQCDFIKMKNANEVKTQRMRYRVLDRQLDKAINRIRELEKELQEYKDKDKTLN